MRAKSNYQNRKPISLNNQHCLNQTKALSRAIIGCNALGLEIQEIDFHHIKPRIVVKENQGTASLEYNGRAIQYGTASDAKGKHYKMQIMVEGIKVMWHSYRLQQLN